jgi:hypothetical protein
MKIIVRNNQQHDDADTISTTRWAKEDRKHFHAVQAGRAKHRERAEARRARQYDRQG